MGVYRWTGIERTYVDIRGFRKVLLRPELWFVAYRANKYLPQVGSFGK